MSFFDRLGAGNCSGGETIRPALEIADKDGNLVDLTGRTFVYWITAAGAKLHESVAAITGTRAVASVPGAKTREIAGRVGLEHWWIEQVTDGFRQWNRAALTVRSAGPDASGLAAPAEDIVRVTDRGVMRIVADGAPGLSAWQALGYETAENLVADKIDAPIDAAIARADEATTQAIEALGSLGVTPALVELLAPAGATTIMSDPANAILIGDLM